MLKVTLSPVFQKETGFLFDYCRYSSDRVSSPPNMSLPEGGRHGGLQIAKLLLILLMLVGYPAPVARGAPISLPEAESVAVTEGRGDRLFKAGNYPDSAKEYERALKTLGFDANRFNRLEPGTITNLQDPFRAAVLMRKWARTTQFKGDTKYAGGSLSLEVMWEALLQATFAAASAANVLEGLRENVAVEEEPHAREIGEELRQAYDIQIEVFYLASRQQGFITRALEVSNKARSRSIFDLAHQRAFLRLLPPQAADIEGRRLLLRIRIGETNQTLLAERAESAPRANVLADLERRLRAARAELAALQPKSPQNASTKGTSGGASASSSWSRTPGDIAGALSWRARLKVGEAVLQYHLTDRFAFAFLVPDTGPVKMELLRPNAQQLHSLVRSYAEKLKDPRLPWKQTSTELYVELLSRFDHMIENLDHLFIVPSGFLYQVPFGTLYDSRSGKIFAERIAHSILPHMALINLTPSIQASPTAAALGIRYFRLHNTLSLGEDEAIAVRDTLGESTMLLLGSRNDATRKQLFTQIPKHKILHLSTHGLPDRQPMLSSIILKRPDGRDDSISALDLLEAGGLTSPLLVTMSACDTGRVNPGLGDDILGLPRAFLLTGSVTVVATLWPIQQESTKYLMEEFYRTLRTAGVTVSGAMNLAQQRTATRKDKNWQHPHYWGAVVVVGDGTIALFQEGR